MHWAAKLGREDMVVALAVSGGRVDIKSVSCFMKCFHGLFTLSLPLSLSLSLTLQNVSHYINISINIYLVYLLNHKLCYSFSLYKHYFCGLSYY